MVRVRVLGHTIAYFVFVDLLELRMVYVRRDACLTIKLDLRMSMFGVAKYGMVTPKTFTRGTGKVLSGFMIRVAKLNLHCRFDCQAESTQKAVSSLKTWPCSASGRLD